MTEQMIFYFILKNIYINAIVNTLFLKVLKSLEVYYGSLQFFFSFVTLFLIFHFQYIFLQNHEIH